MDSKCKLNKSEMIRVTQLLDNFILDDPKINLFAIQSKVKEELTEKLQKDFEEKLQITPEIKTWLENHDIIDVQNIYYSDRSYSYHHKYDNNPFRVETDCICGENTNCILIKSYCYQFGHYYTNHYFTDALKIFEEVYDKYIKDFNEKLEVYIKTKKEMIIVLNTLKTAQNVLDKFGFIESINRYINTLLSEQAKPISCMTQAVENSVDNYLKRRKELDEDKK